MNQLQWRAIGKVAAKFVKMRNSTMAASPNKCTREAVSDGLTTIYADNFTKANSQKINYVPESWRIHMSIGVGFAGIELHRAHCIWIHHSR